LQEMSKNHLSSQTLDNAAAHALVELHHETFFLSASKTDTRC